jgi:hypothetical protein
VNPLLTEQERAMIEGLRLVAQILGTRQADPLIVRAFFLDLFVLLEAWKRTAEAAGHMEGVARSMEEVRALLGAYLAKN